MDNTKDITSKALITTKKLEKYFSITKKAIETVESSQMDNSRIKDAKDFLNMAKCYYSDALHFFEKKDYINAFAAINYAHGWLDAGARIKLFDVHDNTLFTVD
jgi:hypothetical protein